MSRPIDRSARVHLGESARQIHEALRSAEIAMHQLSYSSVVVERMKNLPVQEYAGLIQVAIDALRKAEKLGEELDL